jgi:hypothetical protein
MAAITHSGGNEMNLRNRNKTWATVRLTAQYVEHISWLILHTDIKAFDPLPLYKLFGESMSPTTATSGQHTSHNTASGYDTTAFCIYTSFFANRNLFAKLNKRLFLNNTILSRVLCIAFFLKDPLYYDNKSDRIARYALWLWHSRKKAHYFERWASATWHILNMAQGESSC